MPKKALTEKPNPGSMALMKTKTLIVTFAVWVAAGAICLAANPAMGTWKLNEAKSKMPKGLPKNTMVVYKAAGMGKTKVIVDGVDGDSKAAHNEWTGKFDGKDYAVTGDPATDMRAYKKVDDHNLDFNGKKSGKIMYTGHVSISSDGKSRTVTVNGTNAKGKKYTISSVYNKQ